MSASLIPNSVVQGVRSETGDRLGVLLCDNWIDL